MRNDILRVYRLQYSIEVFVKPTPMEDLSAPRNPFNDKKTNEYQRK